MIIVVMGVCGCGKTTIAQKLATRTGSPFVEGDDLHPTANKKKMSSGVALGDDDRWSWLDAIAAKAATLSTKNNCVVVSCSALKRIYRQRLQCSNETTIFVHLTGVRSLLEQRMTGRHGHFMPAGLLDSQLATLEIPGPDENVLTLDIATEPDRLVAEIQKYLNDRDQKL
jgi:gluconokinase